MGNTLSSDNLPVEIDTLSDEETRGREEIGFDQEASNDPPASMMGRNRQAQSNITTVSNDITIDQLNDGVTPVRLINNETEEV